MLTSLSEQSTPAELSMKSVLIRPPCSANSIRAAWVMPRLAPSPIALTRRSAALTRIASLPGSPTSALALAARLHVGADAAEPEQVDLGLQDRADQGGRLDLLGLDAEHRADLGGVSGIDFWLRGKTPPPFEISALS